jgi:hypothetical protein
VKNLALKQKEELKKLQSLLIKQKSEIDLIKRERQLINERLSVAERNLRNTEEELKKLKTGNKIIVSEHAVLRYLERTMELDLKAVENEILSEEVVSQYRTLGNGKYPVSNGCKAVIKDNVVLTITK